MDRKKEIESVLNSLKEKGYTRAEIESELDYSENYIDQQLSKGGNPKFLNSLKKLNERLLQKAIPDTSKNQEFKPNEPILEALSQQLLADLVYTNRNLSESNRSLALSHEGLVDMVKKDSRPDEAQHTMNETVALVKALKETMIEIVADVKGVSKVEASQILHNKVMAVMEKVGKKDSRTVVSK